MHCLHCSVFSVTVPSLSQRVAVLRCLRLTLVLPSQPWYLHHPGANNFNMRDRIFLYSCYWQLAFCCKYFGFYLHPWSLYQCSMPFTISICEKLRKSVMWRATKFNSTTSMLSTYNGVIWCTGHTYTERDGQYWGVKGIASPTSLLETDMEIYI